MATELLDHREDVSTTREIHETDPLMEEIHKTDILALHPETMNSDMTSLQSVGKTTEVKDGSLVTDYLPVPDDTLTGSDTALGNHSIEGNLSCSINCVQSTQF